jgi:hypothetical protein
LSSFDWAQRGPTIRAATSDMAGKWRMASLLSVAS